MRARALAAIAGLSTVIWMGVPVTASAASAQTFTIGVDHADPANQQLDANGQPTTPPGVQPKVFEYTDFFTRAINVHQGDTVDFRFAIPDHLIQVAPDEVAARQQSPLFSPDETTAIEGNALGSGGPKIVLGAPVFANFGGAPACGQSAATRCLFDGSQPSDLGFASPSSADWFLQVNAAVGTYSYFCHFHPGMRGTVQVLPNTAAVQSQNQIDQLSAVQFSRDQREAVALYDEANQVNAQQTNSGPTVYSVSVGVTSRDRHIAIHDMLPSNLSLKAGDIVRYHWQTNVIHTVEFAPVSPFGVDCETSYAPLTSSGPLPCPSGAPEFSEPSPIFPAEVIADPGNQASGTLLNGASDSGLLVGASYAQYYGGLGSDSWSIKADGIGAHLYFCAIHDWMTGTITVGN